MTTPQAPFKSYNSPKDLEQDSIALESMFGHSRFAHCLVFSSEHTIKKPPILSRLPACIPLEFKKLKQIKTTSKKTEFTAMEGLISISNFDLISSALNLDTLKPQLYCKERGVRHFAKEVFGLNEISETYCLEMYHQLRQEVFNYVKTGRTRRGLAVVKQAIVLLTLYYGGNEDVLYVLSDAGSPLPVMQNACAEVLFCRVAAFMEHICKVDVRRFCLLAKNRMFKYDLKINIRNSVMALLGTVSTYAEYTAMVTVRIPGILKNARVDPAVAQKIIHMLQSHSSDHEKAQSVYEEWFLPGSLKDGRTLYTPCRIGSTSDTYISRVIEKHVETDYLYIYPGKDYLDYMKGYISGDCTDGVKLAAAHLDTPEFFNMRIVHNDRWIGNIYCLDFSDTQARVVIDRIQLSDLQSWMNFFSTLEKSLFPVFEQGIKVLLPTTLSSRSSVQSRYYTYRNKFDVKSFVINDIDGKAFQRFESVSRSDRFLVVRVGVLA